MRSTRSLIQTMGRAARHINGTAILYADRITSSMRNAMDEIERRRTKQILFNQQHHIVPRSVNKQIKDMIDGIYAPENTSQNLQIAQTEARYSSMDESQLAKEIQLLEKICWLQRRTLNLSKQHIYATKSDSLETNCSSAPQPYLAKKSLIPAACRH